MANVDKSKLVDIINIDYATLLAGALSIKDKYASLVDWDMSNPNDPLGVILEAYLRSIEKDANYANLIAQEFSLATALSKDSIFEKAFLAGYNVTLRSAATCLMNLTVAAGSAGTISPFELVIKGVNSAGSSIYFENSQPIVIPPASSETVLADVLFTEGRTYEKVVNASGVPFESITIQDSVIDGTVVLRVNGVAWSEVFSINSNTLPTDSVFELRHLGRNTYQVMGGDGKNGALFPTDSIISVKYRIGQGSEGNLYTYFINTVFKTPFVRVIGVSNRNSSDTASGGQDMEDLEKVRALAPKLSKINGTLGNRWDVDLYLNSYPGVGLGKSKEVGMDYFYAYIANEIGEPSAAFILQLEEDIRPRLIMGASIKVATATRVSVALSLEIIYDLSYERSMLETSIQLAITNFLNPFAYSTTREKKISFGTDLLISDIYEEVTAIPGVIAISILDPVPATNTILVRVLDTHILTHIGSSISLTMVPSSESQSIRIDKREKYFFSNPKYR